MEPPKQLFGSRILVATTENYRELISSPGNTLVIYSSWAGIYACDRRIRQAFWRIEEDYPRKQLNLVLVDISQCRTDPDTIETIPRFRLFRDGKELLPLQSRHNNGELLRAWLTEGIGPAPMKEAPIDWYRGCDLPHGLRLKIWNTSGRLPVRLVTVFLARAMDDFSYEMDKAVSGVYDGGNYRSIVKDGQKVLGGLEVSYPNDEGRLPARLWHKAVVYAYTRANLVRKMAESRPMWEEMLSAEGREGFAREAVGMLDKRGGDLLAMAAMIKRGLNRG